MLTYILAMHSDCAVFDTCTSFTLLTSDMGLGIERSREVLYLDLPLLCQTKGALYFDSLFSCTCQVFATASTGARVMEPYT